MNHGGTTMATAPAGALRIVINETEDEDRDRGRLTALLQALAQHPGETPVRLLVRTHDGNTVEFALPPARYCAELLAALESALAEHGEIDLADAPAFH